MSPALVLEGETPRLIDEWQEVPPLWDAVRYTVDQRGKRMCSAVSRMISPA